VQLRHRLLLGVRHPLSSLVAVVIMLLAKRINLVIFWISTQPVRWWRPHVFLASPSYSIFSVLKNIVLLKPFARRPSNLGILHLKVSGLKVSWQPLRLSSCIGSDMPWALVSGWLSFLIAAVASLTLQVLHTFLPFTLHFDNRSYCLNDLTALLCEIVCIGESLRAYEAGSYI